MKLTEIINQIRKELEEDTFSDGYKQCHSLEEEIDLETYSFLSEVRLDIKNSYDYKESHLKGMFVFEDQNKYQHFIRLLKQKDRWEIKIGFFELGTTKPVYTKPKIFHNLDYDEKVFNTHLRILFEELLPYFFDNSLLKPEEKILYLPALDTPRYRLYRIAISKFIDKSKYDVVLIPEEKTIVIQHKTI